MCDAVQCFAFWSYFNFTIVDFTTGKDLIFGNNPTLTPADFKLYVKSNSPYTQIITNTDSAKNYLYTMTAGDTMAIQIKDDPLRYILVKTFCTQECCSRNAVEILYEGQLLIADKTKLIRIPR